MKDCWRSGRLGGSIGRVCLGLGLGSQGSGIRPCSSPCSMGSLLGPLPLPLPSPLLMLSLIHSLSHINKILIKKRTVQPSELTSAKMFSPPKGTKQCLELTVSQPHIWEGFPCEARGSTVSGKSSSLEVAANVFYSRAIRAPH